MGDTETSKRGRFSDDAASRTRQVVRGWTESERQKLLLNAEQNELRRRSLRISAFTWCLFATAAQTLSVLVWLKEPPLDLSLASSLVVLLVLGLWIVQGSLGVRAYGSFLGCRSSLGLLGAGAPVWGFAWTIHRFLAYREAHGLRSVRSSTRPIMVYLGVCSMFGWISGLLVLSVDGGLRDGPVWIEVAGHLLIAAVGSFSALRIWSDLDVSIRRAQRQRLVSLWAWYLPIIGPFWAFWQLSQEGAVDAASKLVGRSYESPRHTTTKALWQTARETLAVDWQRKKTVGRWLGWRDRPTTARSVLPEDTRFRRLCQDQCALVFPGAVFLGWILGKTGHPWRRFLDPGSGEWFLGLVVLCGGLSVLGAFQSGMTLLRRGPQSPSAVGKHQIGSFLVSGQFALLCGLCAGVCVVPAPPEAASLFVTAGVLALFLGRTWFQMARKPGLRDYFASVPVVLLALWAVQLRLRADLASDVFLYWLLLILFALGLCGGPVLLWRHGASLVHPLHLSDLFRPGLPWRARLWLIVLPLTVVLPGGGLAVPVWVWMRLRWWKHLVAARKALLATN